MASNSLNSELVALGSTRGALTSADPATRDQMVAAFARKLVHKYLRSEGSGAEHDDASAGSWRRARPQTLYLSGCQPNALITLHVMTLGRSHRHRAQSIGSVSLPLPAAAVGGGAGAEENRKAPPRELPQRLRLVGPLDMDVELEWTSDGAGVDECTA